MDGQTSWHGHLPKASKKKKSIFFRPTRELSARLKVAKGEGNGKFQLKVTSSSFTVSSNIIEIRYSETKFRQKQLWFFREFSRNVRILQEITDKKPLFFQFNEKLIKNSADCWEVDLTAAYWQSAFLNGIIDRRLYEQGLKVDKLTRLAAIGSLIKKEDLFLLENNNLEKIACGYVHPFFFSTWQTIVGHVDDTMRAAVSEIGSDFLFFWVDAVFVANLPAAEKASAIFTAFGYESKLRRITRIENFGAGFRIFEEKNGEEKGRTFYFPSNLREKLKEL